MLFGEIVGQESTKQKLLLQVKENRVSHAQLFLGPHGCGNLALALAYAQYIMCEQKKNDDSCGECPSCRKNNKLIHPDLHFSFPFFAKSKEETAEIYLSEWRNAVLENSYLDLEEWQKQLNSENKQANINIAECHRIIKRMALKPFESEFKIFILWLPEFLDKNGNVLLKLIEEPPEKTLFLFVANQSDRILSTIISRTQLIKIPAFDRKDIIHFLIDKKQIESQKAEVIAGISEGSLQKAVVHTQQTESDYFSTLTNWLRKCYANDGIGLVNISNDIAGLGRESQKNFLLYGIEIIRNCLLATNNAQELIRLDEQEKTFVNNFSKVVNSTQLQSVITELEQSCYHIERNANPKILFLDVSLQLVKILKFKIIPD